MKLKGIVALMLLGITAWLCAIPLETNAYAFAISIPYIFNNTENCDGNPATIGWGDGTIMLDYAVQDNPADSSFSGWQFMVWSVKCDNTDGSTRPAVDGYSDTVYTATAEYYSGEYVVTNDFGFCLYFNLPLSNIDLPDGRPFNIDKFDTLYIKVTDKYGAYSAASTAPPMCGTPQTLLLKFVWSDPYYDALTGTIDIVNPDDTWDYFGVGPAGGFYLTGDCCVAIDNGKPALPSKATLAQNSPNPFNASTEISFMLPTQGDVKLEITDVLGKHVKTLANANMNSGNHILRWDGTDDNLKECPSGVYFYKLSVGNDFVDKKQMTLVK